MSGNGIILIIFWILSLLCISFYGGPVSYGMFATATLIPVVLLAYLFIIFLRFKIYQRLNSKNVIAGNISDFYITLQNEDFFAYAGIRIQFYSSFSEIEGIDDKTEYELLPHCGIKRQTTLLCRYRGEYEVGVKSVMIQDFLRVFTFSYHNPEPFRVTVLPQIVHLDSVKTVEAAVNAVSESYRSPEFPDATVREYVPGDDIRKIHWNSSAKLGKLLTRKTIGEEKQGIGIVMDSERYSDDPEIYLPIENKILETVIAFAMYYVRNHTPVRVYTYSNGLSEWAVNDIGGFDGFYRDISSTRFSEDNTQEKLFIKIEEVPSFYENNLVILVLHKWSETAKEAVASLGKNNGFSVIYIVSDDLSEIKTGSILPHSEAFVIPPDADLREVL